MSRIEYAPNPPPQTLTDQSSKDLALYLQNELTQIQSFISAISGDKGVASAWVAYDESGGIDSSYNISSVVKTATGKFDITFTSPKTSADYCAVTSSSTVSGGTRIAQVYSKTATEFKVSVKDLSDVLSDAKFINVAVYANA